MMRRFRFLKIYPDSDCFICITL